MKFCVNKRTLFIIAGMVWITAGINIFRIGIGAWINHGKMVPDMLLMSFTVFLFFLFIFYRHYTKYSRRIKQKETHSNPLSFLDKRGWFIMLGMMTLGAVLRHTHLVSPVFISTFYTGLSLALMLNGILFMRQVPTIDTYDDKKVNR